MSSMVYPSPEQPAGQPLPWYTVWMQVITHPSKDSFRRILADPTARPARAFIWVAVVGLIFGVLQAVVSQVFGFRGLGETSGLGMAGSLVCISIGAPIFAVIGLALGSAILRGVASLLGGQGNFNDLVYSLGAISAPVSVISSIISIIVNVASGGMDLANPAAGGAGSIVGLCLLPISLAVGVYAVALQVMAVSVVEKLTTGKAVLTVLIPLIVVILLFGCLAVVFGAAMFGVLQQMGQ